MRVATTLKRLHLLEDWVIFQHNWAGYVVLAILTMIHPLRIRTHQSSVNLYHKTQKATPFTRLAKIKVAFTYTLTTQYHLLLLGGRDSAVTIS